MAPFLLLLLGLTAKRGCASSSQDNISEEAVPALAASPNKKVYGWGDSCEDECSEESNTVCEKSTKTCECASDHPVVIHNKFCVKPVLLGNRCIHADQCVYHDAHAICREYSENYTTCVCSDQYVVKSLEGLHLPKLCFPNLSALQPDVPTLLGLGLGMSVFSLLICLVLKIFARARFVRPRGYADAHINPPLTVSGDGSSIGSVRRDGKVYGYTRRQSYPQRRASALSRLPSPQRVSLQTLRVIPEPGAGIGGRHIPTHILATRMGSAPIAISAETYAAYALAAQRSHTSSPAGHLPRRSSSRTSITSRSSLPSSRRASYTQRPNSRPSSRSGSRRPSSASLRSTVMEVPHGRVDHYLYMRTPVYGHPSDSSNDDKSPRTPRSSDQLLAVYRSVPEHSVVEIGGAVASSYTTTSTSLGGGMSSYTLGTPSIEDVFQEEDEDGLEQEKEEEEDKEEEENTEEEVKEDPEAKLIA